VRSQFIHQHQTSMKKESMSYTDKQITCVDCGTEFTFSSGEQERFAQLGFTNEPKRCSSCRAAKKAAQGSAGGASPRSSGSRAARPGGPREMFPAVCAECGKPTQVPFQPRGDRPVYCSDCFSNRR
jgi:CxxC-x17-CxxC domain-containing protein